MRSERMRATNWDATSRTSTCCRNAIGTYRGREAFSKYERFRMPKYESLADEITVAIALLEHAEQPLSWTWPIEEILPEGTIGGSMLG
jgi:hypothetical protein